MFMYAALASSLNIIMGYTGYADFGNIVYFGIGAYTTGILVKLVGLPLPLAMVLGAALCALFAAVLGLPILRLRGNYFAIATLGLSQAVRELVKNMSFTGGGAGFSLPMLRLDPRTFNTIVYFMMLGLLLLNVVISYLVSRSRFGYGLRALKADEQGASVMGIDTTRHKIMAWALSAFMTGLVGGAYAFWFVYFTADEVFNILVSVKYLVMTYLGGIGTVLGPVIGAFLLEYLSDYVWGRFMELHLGVLGLTIILIVLFMPRGFLYMVRTKVRPLLARVLSRSERS
jgi:branched-chain amino acid transport system permease protein